MGGLFISDVTARRREDERRLSDVLDALPAAVYMTDANGRITYYNEAAVDLWGHRPELGTSEWCGSWKLYWPDGTPMPHDGCPMAMALKQRRPIRGVEAVAERPDGTRVLFIPYPTPIFDSSGELVGAVNMLVDITHRKHSEQTLRRQADELATLATENASLLRTAETELEHRRQADVTAQRLAAIVESSDDAIFWKDLNGVIQSWNNGAERLFGYTVEEAIGRPVTILYPDDRKDEAPRILARIQRGERVDHYETIRQRKDGRLIDISLSVSPVKDTEGRIIGASKIARDITERRRTEEQQRLLLREMNHRVKNLMTLASSLVTLSARSAKTPSELASAVRDRLAALARAHELTLPPTLETETTEKETTLRALIKAIVSPYDPDHSRVTIGGDDFSIGPRAATNMALLLHEFTTNAAKYGALSTATGRIKIESTNVDGQCVLLWSEHGGPRVVRGNIEGFGTLLSRNTVQHALAGDIVRDWKPEGLSIRLAVACERLTI